MLYSWAGEKMPWLTIHLVRPAILLASLFLGALLASIITAAARAAGLRGRIWLWLTATPMAQGYDYRYDEEPAIPQPPEVPRRSP